MSIATLNDIILKVRKLTGSATNLQLTDAMIIDYINSFYIYDFPAKFRSLKLKDVYTFNCVQGVDVYPFDYNHWSTVQGPAFCMKRQIGLFTSENGFYNQSYVWGFQQNFAFGNGGPGVYAGILTSTPIIRSYNNNPMVSSPLTPTIPFPLGVPVPFPQTNISRVQNLLITANTATSSVMVTDDGNGNLIGDCLVGGTIDYQTGQISNLIFTANIPGGNVVQAQYNPCAPNIPLSIMFKQNQFTLRPVPDRSYTIEITGYRLPSQVLMGSLDPNNPDYDGVPELLEWWETIAFGAAKKVFEDRMDEDGIALADKGLAERYDANEVRTYAQLGKESIDTLYRNQVVQNSHSYGGGGIFFGNQGQGGQ